MVSLPKDHRIIVMNENLKTNLRPPHEITISEAITYIFTGLKLALSKECRLYIIIPLIVNVLFMSTCSYLLFTNIKALIFSLFEGLPDFLSFVAYVLSYLLGLMIIFVCGYFFSTVATIIASPFYGLLADKVEALINGTHGDDMGVVDLLKDIPRILAREFKKQLFFLPLALICLVISIIPVINVFSPIAWFLLTAWMGALQYTDYAYDNHKISFTLMMNDLKTHTIPTFTIGATVAFLLGIPVLNILIPPAAVCAGTKYYVEMQKVNSLK